MNLNKLIPVSKWNISGFSEAVDLLFKNMEEEFDVKLKNLHVRINNLEEPLPEEIRTINFSKLSLPWQLKDDDDGYASILADDGATLAVGVRTEIAEVIITLINSYEI